MNSKIETSLANGYSFLASRQLPSGEFPTVEWVGDDSCKRVLRFSIKSVFVTSFVLHSLKYINKFVDTQTTAQKAIEFLLGEMESNGFWRFYGKNTNLPPDIDDTSCILAALQEWSVKIDYEAISERLLKFRNKNKIFKTWLLEDNSTPSGNINGQIDWVVNANVLFFFSLINKTLPEVEQYLLSQVENGNIRYRSAFYPSLSGIYCLTRALTNSHRKEVETAISKISRMLSNNAIKGSKDNLSAALLACIFLNCQEKEILFSPLINYLMYNQRKDGGWATGVLFSAFVDEKAGAIFKWGGEAVTAAIVLEAFSRHLYSSI